MLPVGVGLVVEVEVGLSEDGRVEPLFAAADGAGDGDAGGVDAGAGELVVEGLHVGAECRLADGQGCVLRGGVQGEPAAGEQQAAAAVTQGRVDGLGSDLGSQDVDRERVGPAVVVAVGGVVGPQYGGVVNQDVGGAEVGDRSLKGGT